MKASRINFNLKGNSAKNSVKLLPILPEINQKKTFRMKIFKIFLNSLKLSMIIFFLIFKNFNFNF